MNKEDFFIKQFDSKYIGDDGAYIDGYVYAMDSFFQDIHFKLSWCSLYDIAQKSVLVNISDAIVMNAVPKYILLSCAIPSHFSLSQIKELAKGFNDTSKKFGAQIIGGDTIKNDKLHISITTISKTKKPIYRKGIKHNDLIAFTGDIGLVKKQLNKALRFNIVNSNSKLISPKLNPLFFYEASKHISSAIDISDGLFTELKRLSKQNKIGFKLYKKIKYSIGCSGEEYEILFSFNKSHKRKIINIAKKHRIKINIFAKATKKSSYKCICKAQHF